MLREEQYNLLDDCDYAISCQFAESYNNWLKLFFTEVVVSAELIDLELGEDDLVKQVVVNLDSVYLLNYSTSGIYYASYLVNPNIRHVCQNIESAAYRLAVKRRDFSFF